MFSMILKLQAFLEKLKKRKALWFTTITILSIFGIISTLYYLNTMTHRATKNLYEATNVSYFYDLESKIADSLLNLEIVGSMLLANQEFVTAINVENNATSIITKLLFFITIFPLLLPLSSDIPNPPLQSFHMRHYHLYAPTAVPILRFYGTKSFKRLPAKQNIRIILRPVEKHTVYAKSRIIPQRKAHMPVFRAHKRCI